jgi:O-antigen ligase
MSDELSAPDLRQLSRGRITWLLGFLFGLALIPFATVHDTPRLLVGITCGVVGAVAVISGSRSRPTVWIGRLWAAAFAALAVSTLAFLPLGAGARGWLQPGVAEAVNASLALVGVSSHTLALDPWAAVTGWAFAGQALLVALGTATVLRGVRRARRLAMVLVGSGVALVVVALAHRLTGAEHIWWVTGVPEYSKDPFFGTFVNPNQGGGVCAALVPLALALGARVTHTQSRLLSLGVAAALTLGVFLARSRGAVLDLAVGLAVLGIALGHIWARRAALAAAAGAVVVAVALDAGELARRVSNVLAPGPVYDDPFTGRLEIWADTARVVLGAPLMGVGLGGYEDAYKIAKSTPLFASNPHAHNDLLQALAEQGVLGGTLWIGAGLAPMVLAARRCAHKADATEMGRRQAMLAGYLGTAAALLTAALFTFPTHIGAMAVLIALVAGALARGSAHEDPARISAKATAALRASAIGLAAVTTALSLAMLSPLGDRLNSEVSLAAGDAAWERGQAGDRAAVIEAIDQYRYTLGRRPLEHRAMLRLARARMAAGDQQGALEALEVATVAYPTLPWPWLNLARLRTSMGDRAGARVAWRNLLATDLPDNDELRAYMDEALSSGDDLAQVIEEVVPDRPERMRQIAAVLSKRGEVELAEALFKRNLELDPEAVVAYASHLLQWKRPREALALLEDIHDSCFAARVAGRAHLMLDEAKEAEARFREGLNLCGSDDPQTRVGFAQARLLSDDPEGIVIATNLLESNPDAHGLRRSLLRRLRAERRQAEVKEHLEYLVLAGEATTRENEELISLLAED